MKIEYEQQERKMEDALAYIDSGGNLRMRSGASSGGVYMNMHSRHWSSCMFCPEDDAPKVLFYPGDKITITL